MNGCEKRDGRRDGDLDISTCFDGLLAKAFA